MSEVDTMINLMFKSANLVIDSQNYGLNICDLVLRSQQLDMNPINTVWKNAIEEQKVDIITFESDEQKKEILKKLTEDGIPYKDYGDMVFTLTINHNQVDRILSGNVEIVPIEKELEEISNYRSMEVSVNSDDIWLYTSKLENNNVPYSVSAYGFQGMYKIIIPDTYKEIMDNIKLDVAIDKQSEYADIVTREMENESKYKVEMFKTIGSRNESIGDFYIADYDGKAIIGNQKFLSYEVNGKSEFLLTKNKDISAFKTSFIEMKMPTILTKEEYDEFLKTDNKRDFLIDKRREQGLGVFSDEETQILMEQDRKRELLASKLRQEHPIEIARDLDDYNSEQSFFYFKEAEKENYELSHDLNEVGYVDATILNEVLMECRGIDIEESSIEYSKISEIEASIFNENVEERNERIDEIKREIAKNNNLMEELDNQEADNIELGND